MEKIGYSEESYEVAFSETEMDAAKQLIQLSEDDTLSCSSGTGWSVSCVEKGEGDNNNTKRQAEEEEEEVVVSSKVRDHHLLGNEQNDGVRGNNKSFMKAIMETKTRINKKNKKFRSLSSIYRATKEMTTRG